LFLQITLKIYRGYVDDPRNTDNSWMETIAFNFHDEDGSLLSKFKLEAGMSHILVKHSNILQLIFVFLLFFKETMLVI
jgi:hypothetical protein